jgi:hypothetical protein
MKSVALIRPVSSMAYELRSCWASGHRVVLTLERCDRTRLEGHVQRVAATDAYVQVSGLHVPLDRVLAVYRPSRLGDSTFRGGAWSGRVRRVEPQSEQLWAAESGTKLKQSEKQFEAAVREYAELNSWKTFHPFDSRRSNPGWPDLTMARKGRIVVAELKAEKGRVSKAQEAWLGALQAVAIRANSAEEARALFEKRTPMRIMEVCLWTPDSWLEIESVLGK